MSIFTLTEHGTVDKKKSSALIFGWRDWRYIIDDEKYQKHSKLIDDCQFALNPCRSSCTPHTTFGTRTLQKSNCNGAGFRLCACAMNDWRTDRVTEKMAKLTWKPLKTVVERPSVKYCMVGYRCRTHRQNMLWISVELRQQKMNEPTITRSCKLEEIQFLAFTNSRF